MAVKPKRRYSKMEEGAMVRVLKDVAVNYGRTLNAVELAKKHGINSKQVTQYASNLRGVGVDIPKYRRAGIYLRVLDELRKEHPELVRKHRKGKTT